jgi:hypothetical protein
MRCFPRDEPTYWLRLTKGPQIGYVIRIPTRTAKEFLAYADKNEFVTKLRDLFNDQHTPATFSPTDYVNLETYFETPYQYLFPDDPTQPPGIPSYNPRSVVHAKESDTQIVETVNMSYEVMAYRSRVYEFQVMYTKDGTTNYYNIQVHWDWVDNNWVAWAETVLQVTDLQVDGLLALRFVLTNTDPAAAFGDVDPRVAVYPPYSFVPTSVQHTLAAPTDYKCQVTMEYEWQMTRDRQYLIQLSWTVPSSGPSVPEENGTVTAIVKYDRDVSVRAWTADTGDAKFPVTLTPLADLKVIDLELTRAGTVPSGFTFDDVDPIVKVEQLMA